MGIFEPAWKSMNLRSAYDALRKTSASNQVKLMKFIVNSPHNNIKMEALNRLTDQNMLAEIIKTPKLSFVHAEAVKKLTDQAIIVDIAKHVNVFHGNAHDLLRHLTEQELITDVATNGYSDAICAAAVEKVNSQSGQAALAEIAQTDKNGKYQWARIRAIEKITDQTVLAKLTKSDDFVRDFGNNRTYIRGFAAKRLADLFITGTVTDRSIYVLLTDLLDNDAEPAVRAAAAQVLTDQAIIADLAKTDRHTLVRKMAVDKLETQADLVEIAKSSDTIAQGDTKWRHYVYDVINSRWRMDFDVRMIALNKIVDRDMLRDVSEYAADEKIREKAALTLSVMK